MVRVGPQGHNKYGAGKNSKGKVHPITGHEEPEVE
jgi:hypothetical protein